MVCEARAGWAAGVPPQASFPPIRPRKSVAPIRPPLPGGEGGGEGAQFGQGGVPPHTPPERSTRGFLRLAAWCVRLVPGGLRGTPAGSFPRSGLGSPLRRSGPLSLGERAGVRDSPVAARGKEGLSRPWDSCRAGVLDSGFRRNDEVASRNDGGPRKSVAPLRPPLLGERVRVRGLAARCSWRRGLLRRELSLAASPPRGSRRSGRRTWRRDGRPRSACRAARPCTCRRS